MKKLILAEFLSIAVAVGIFAIIFYLTENAVLAFAVAFFAAFFAADFAYAAFAPYAAFPAVYAVFLIAIRTFAANATLALTVFAIVLVFAVVFAAVFTAVDIADRLGVKRSSTVISILLEMGLICLGFHLVTAAL